jgi:thioesterase domain-containing protein/acyl carrier protein
MRLASPQTASSPSLQLMSPRCRPTVSAPPSPSHPRGQDRMITKAHRCLLVAAAEQMNMIYKLGTLKDAIEFYEPLGRAMNRSPASGVIIDALPLVRAAVLDVLGMDDVSDDSSFFALGAKSLDIVHLQSKVGAAIGKEIPLRVLFENQTIRDLCKWISSQRRLAGEREAVIQLKAVGADGPTVLFVPTVKGQITDYITLIDMLQNKNIRIVGLQAVGLPNNGFDADTIEETAEMYAAEISRAGLRSINMIIGFSFGGLLAFEICRALPADSQTAPVLALIEPTDPNHGRTAAIDDDLQYWAEVYSTRTGLTMADLRRFTDRDEMVDEILNRLEARSNLNVLYQLAGRERARILIQTQCVNFLSYWRYRATTRYEGDAILFTASDPIDSSAEALSDSSERKRVQAWEGLLLGNIKHISVTGNHDNCLKRPHVQAIAAQIVTRLTEAYL